MTTSSVESETLLYAPVLGQPRFVAWTQARTGVLHHPGQVYYLCFLGGAKRIILSKFLGCVLTPRGERTSDYS